ncbi:MAG: chloride channel protein [Planctomycetes bacterium]|nr:chloride channel protein [Planctomycetota bacterium]
MTRPSLANRLRIRLGLDREWWLVVVAAGLGVAMGTAAIGFILPIRWLERLPEHLGEESAGMSQTLLLIAPCAGALLTGLVFWLFPTNFRGHGVTRVMFAVNREQSNLPMRLGIRHWLASTCTIGSGGSAGPEGPIVTIGATVGSNISRWLRGDGANAATLLGCGSAAGLAAVFNAPLAAIFFTMEVILRDFSLRTFTPIVIASVVSAATAQMWLGSSEPLFGVGIDFFASKAEGFVIGQTPFYVALGLATALIAVGFVRLFPMSEKIFSRIPMPQPLRPLLGAMLLGLLGFAWVGLFKGEAGYPPFFGAGYAPTRQLLDRSFYESALASTSAEMLLIAGAIAASLILKMIATCLTLGSGGAGGLFAPSLLLGAMTGGAAGMLLHAAGFTSAPPPTHLALVGMAAMLASTTHAPLTGVLLVYELTRSYSIMLPLMLTAVIASLASRALFPDSIYTAELSALGIRLGSMSDLTVLRRLHVSNLPYDTAVPVAAQDMLSKVLAISAEQGVDDFVVLHEDGTYRGMVTSIDLRQALVNRQVIPLLSVDEVTRDDLPVVYEDDTLDVALDRFSRHDVERLAVLSRAEPQRVRGLISRASLMSRYQRELEAS